MKGAFRREWRVLLKDDNTADGCFSIYPKGNPKILQYRVTVLANGATITCNLCLDFKNFGIPDFLTLLRPKVRGIKPQGI